LVTVGAAVTTTAPVNGSLFMMIAHGITSAAMFFIVGVVYERAHHREINRFGGLATTMPVYTGYSTVAFFAHLGLPVLCGFVGEVMVLLGAFQAAKPDSILMQSGANWTTIIVYSVISCLGVVLTAGYMLWTMQRVFLGREQVVLVPLTVMAILLGVLPWAFFFIFTNSTVQGLFRAFKLATMASL